MATDSRWAAAKPGYANDRVETFLRGRFQIPQAMKPDSFNPYFLTLAAEAHLAVNEVPYVREKITHARARRARRSTLP